jgi:hypothetical protein
VRLMTCTGAVLAGLVGIQAANAESLGEAIHETTPLIDWRVRYEGVDQFGLPEEADALTSRLRAGFQTGSWKQTSLLGEAVWTNDVVNDFNDTLNGQTQFPVVADPDDIAAVNRFSLTNESLEHTTLTIGRQRIVLDEARFVGNVGWRQNEQTYDGLRAQIGAAGIDVDLAYVGQVNRIFGPDSPIGKWNGAIMLANVSRGFEVGRLTGFVYSLDIDESAALSTDTIGLRFAGTHPWRNLTAIYSASLAQQSDAGANPQAFSETYFMLEGGVRVGKMTFALGLESLGSDGTHRVTTPLATSHAFQGWADKFLGTPAAGLDDQYVRVAYQPGRIGAVDRLGIVGVYHVFEANAGSGRFGDEFDLAVVARKGSVALTLKYATYAADTLFTDTDKLWFSMDYSF